MASTVNRAPVFLYKNKKAGLSEKKFGGTWSNYAKLSKQGSEKQLLGHLIHMWNIKKLQKTVPKINEINT